MRGKESGALAGAIVCLSVALLRMFAPALPFDWMGLVLVGLSGVLMASASFVRHGHHGHGRHCPHHGGPKSAEPSQQADSAKPQHPSFAQMDLLRGCMAQVNWPERDGGLYDALDRLRKEKPFAALCAARGTLFMFSKDATRLEQLEKDTLALLTEVLDHTASAGEEAADPATVNALFSYTLRAIGRMESAQ